MKLFFNTMLSIIAFAIFCYFPKNFAQSNWQTHTINTPNIATDVFTHSLEYMHFRVLGICVWWSCHGLHCHVRVTPELDEYLPDLIVSVYSKKGDDPFWEAQKTLDPVAYQTGNTLFQAVLKSHYHVASNANLSNGNVSAISGTNHYNAIRRKSVDVIGSPLNLFHLPLLMLRPDTTAYVPYYQSNLDTFGRLGLAEALRPETWLPTHMIGKSVLNHWGYEFPRDMTANVYNNYKASLMVAQRAADIVTNHNTLHTVKSTTNSCGKNCVAANVIEEQQDKHEIWQEVYPRDRHVKIGESDATRIGSLGALDEQKGKGNYVFVLWRHYRGCVQHQGKLVYKTVDVGQPQKH